MGSFDIYIKVHKITSNIFVKIHQMSALKRETLSKNIHRFDVEY